jgi:pimeloyl-ACP methyl ester carboxylesterase
MQGSRGKGVMDEKQYYKLHTKIFGPENGVPVLLLHGLSCNMMDWSLDFLERLTKRGCRLILVDNRDVGKSARTNAVDRPGLIWPSIVNALRLPDMFMPRPAYTLSDMAQESVAALRLLGVRAAHIIGVSMGGMIAQRIAIEHPSVALSLTSIMSSSGAPGLPNPERPVSRMLMEKRPVDKITALAQALAFRRLIAGHMINNDIDELERRVTASFDYGTPQGFGGEIQYAAILADRARYMDLARIRCRTAVVHGRADPFLPVEHGRDTAQRINDAGYFEIELSRRTQQKMPISF